MSRQPPVIPPKPRSSIVPAPLSPTAEILASAEPPAQHQNDAKVSPPVTCVSSITVLVKRPPSPPHPLAASQEQQVEPSKSKSKEILGSPHEADNARAEEAVANTAPPLVSQKPTQNASATAPIPIPVAPTPARNQVASNAVNDCFYKEQPNGLRSSSGSSSPASSEASTPNCSSPATRFQTGHHLIPDAAAPHAGNITATTLEGTNSLGAAAAPILHTESSASRRVSRVVQEVQFKLLQKINDPHSFPYPNQQSTASNSGSPFMRNSRLYVSSPHMKPGGAGKRFGPSQKPHALMRQHALIMNPVRESSSEGQLLQETKEKNSSASNLNAGCRAAQVDLTISGVPQSASAAALFSTTNDLLEEATPESQSEEVVVLRPKRANSTGASDGTAPAAESEEERAARAAKKKSRAFDTAKELLSTERTFLTKLNHLEQAEDICTRLHVIEKISAMFREENSVARCVSDDDVKRVFLSVEPIRALSQDVLDKLTERVAQWQQKPRLGDLFVGQVKFFQCAYQNFMSAQDEAVQLLNEQSARNARFVELLTRVLDNFDEAQLGFNALLLVPVQRLPRYLLLLKEYYKNLDDSNLDREDTQKAINGLNEVTRVINERIWEKKCNAKLKAIAGRSAFRAQSDSLFQPGIKLRMFGPVRKIAGRGTQVQDRYLFLFTHKLFVCTESVSGGVADYKLRDKGELEVTQLAIEEPRELQLHEPHSLGVRSTLKGLLFLFRDENDKAAWKKAFLSDPEAATKHELKKLFIPDKYATQCLKCHSQFTFSNRRHHCRICGLLICKACFYGIKLFMRDEDKICRECGEQLRQRRKSSTEGNSQRPLSPQSPQIPEDASTSTLTEKQDSGESSNGSQSRVTSSDERQSSAATIPPPVAPCTSTVDGAERPESKRSTEGSQNSITVTNDSTKQDATNSNPASTSTLDTPSSQPLSRKSAPPAVRVVQESFCHVSSEKLSGTYYVKLLADYSMQFRVAKLDPKFEHQNFVLGFKAIRLDDGRSARIWHDNAHRATSILDKKGRKNAESFTLQFENENLLERWWPYLEALERMRLEAVDDDSTNL